VRQRKPRRRLPPAEYRALCREVWDRDDGRCVECGSSFFLEVDHIVARSRGGDDALENLRLLCRPCHAERHGLVVKSLFGRTL